jgi:excisionase family DNA binding protein
MESMLRLHEVAARLRISTRSVATLIRKGRLPAVRFGRSYLVKPSDFDAFVDASRVSARTERTRGAAAKGRRHAMADAALSAAGW